jgi:thiol-disulfide isomerase/thioredoxin
MMFHCSTAVFVLSFAAAINPLAAQDLVAGKPAPSLQISKWLKGEPVKELAKDRAYVVEFWATWCPPCIAGMPHLTEVQKKHASALTVIGVTSEDENNPLTAVEAMVKAKGDTIGYTIAFDDGQKTNKAWFEAAAQEGIPTCFVVDKNGVIAWIGHPQWVDLILPDVLAGKYEVEALKARPAAIEKRLQRIFLAAALKPDVALKEAEQLTTEHPFLADQIDQGMFGMMLEDQSKHAWPIGERIVKRATAAKDANALNLVAWSIVDPEAKVGERNLELAMTAAAKAVEITASKDAHILDTLARVHAWKGEFPKALELQKKAVALCSEEEKAGLTPALTEYEAKVKAAGAGPGK